MDNELDGGFCSGIVSGTLGGPSHVTCVLYVHVCACDAEEVADGM